MQRAVENLSPQLQNYVENRYGLFIHYGLYSLLARGEWVLNREAMSLADYAKLADEFTAEQFDADALCAFAKRNGMRYLVFTTMHHDGFCLYETELTDFNTVKTAAKRDLVAEVVAAARRHGLRIGLYHSLNNWTSQPDAVAALEDKAAYERFIDGVHARIRELVTRFNPIDILWYDGWWPFTAEGWRAEEMNAMVREIQPHILFNGRNGLPGDMATPEQHVTAPKPWRPWEACITTNGSWCYHQGDHDWKRPGDIIDMLACVAQQQGNLLMNIGPRGDGSIPGEAANLVNTVGDWLARNGESIFATEPFTYDLRERGEHRGDWCFHGPFTASGNNLYLLVRRWPGAELTISGVSAKVNRVSILGGAELPFVQTDGRVVVEAPVEAPDLCPVIRYECDAPPSVYTCGGMREPNVPHPRYDPCESDLPH